MVYGRMMRRWSAMAVLCGISLAPLGCSKFKAKPEGKYIYVTAKTGFLRDRVAAVSNRTGNVVNGQRLKVLDTRPRWYKVQTDAGEIGWIDEHAVATQQVADEFDALQKQLEKTEPVATGTVRDDVYLHDKPGRETDRFYRLDEGDKLKLFQRASTLKPLPPGTTAPTTDPKTGAPITPPMEDWWLVRDDKGHTGWMLGRMMDVDVPDSIARYAEGQRIVAAYVLTKVQDPEIEGASKDVPIYVTAMSPYKSGLPYDFDQLRVFTWNLKKHRYETAQRDRNIAGYLPIRIHTDPGSPSPGRGIPATGPAPAYTYTVLADGQQLPQADANGIFKPGKLVEKTYRLEGNVTRRVLAPGAMAPAEFRLVQEEKKSKRSRKR
ncbi:MAG: SH3 domain-containing protein [Acidobacteria bacterium]|nr:SH3 domain-containing protein [Acidobacteriota bacterium]